MAVGTCTIPPGVVTWREVSNVNGDQLLTSQVRHLYHQMTDFGKKVGDTPASGEYLIHIALAAGTVKAFQCGNLDTGSSASMTFDLKKYAVGGNTGATVLSAAVTVANADTDNTPKAGTINTASYNSGDRFYALLTTSSTTGALSPEAHALFDELSP